MRERSINIIAGWFILLDGHLSLFGGTAKQTAPPFVLVLGSTIFWGLCNPKPLRNAKIVVVLLARTTTAMLLNVSFYVFHG